MMYDDFFTPGATIILTMVSMMVFYSYVKVPSDANWIYWIAFVIMASLSGFIVYCFENIVWHCADATNWKCRIFGHNNRKLGLHVEKMDTMPWNKNPHTLDDWGWIAYKCKRCGEESKGCCEWNLTAQREEKRRNWKVKVF